MGDAEVEGVAQDRAAGLEDVRRRRNSATGQARSPAGRARSGRSGDRASARHNAGIGDIGLGKGHGSVSGRAAAQRARPVAQSAAELAADARGYRDRAARGHGAGTRRPRPIPALTAGRRSAAAASATAASAIRCAMQPASGGDRPALTRPARSRASGTAHPEAWPRRRPGAEAGVSRASGDGYRVRRQPAIALARHFS